MVGLITVSSAWIILLTLSSVHPDQVPANPNAGVPLDLRSIDPQAYADWTYDHVVLSNKCGAEAIAQFNPDPKITSKVAGITQCKLQPTVYYVVDDKASFDTVVKGTLPKNCKYTYVCTHAASGQKICSDEPVLWDGNAASVKAGSAIFSNEPGCQYAVGGTAYRRWIEVTPQMSQIANNVYKSDNQHKLTNGGKEYLMRIPRLGLGPASASDYDGLMFVPYSHSYTECQACRECKASQFMGWETRAHEKFHLTFFVQETCPWVKVCVDTEFDQKVPTVSKNAKCKNGMMVHFDFKSKLVIYGVKNEAVKINFINSDKLNRVDIVRPDDKTITIATSTREKISLPAYSTEQISLLAENANCIEGTTLGLTTAMGCAAGNSPQNPPIKPESESESTFAPREVPTPPTAPNWDATAPPVSTTERPKPPMNRGLAGNSAGQGSKPIPEKMEDALAGKRGWMTWAIFFGCLTGSALGMLIIALILFFCRRTAYNEWYRGMYKRYKCDASGTTGGTTGADFGDTTGAGGMTTVNTIDGGNTTTSNTMTAGSTEMTGGTTASGSAETATGTTNMTVTM